MKDNICKVVYYPMKDFHLKGPIPVNDGYMSSFFVEGKS